MIHPEEVKPLHPLPFGNILIVGAKASNFSDEITSHPRVVIWSSQDEHWLTKELPTNVRAVFVTRWIGHNAFSNVLKEARKKHITMFNPEGTGMIAKQVKELLDLTKKEIVEEPTVTQMETKIIAPTKGKLKALIPFIDFKLNNVEAADMLILKAKEMGITSTRASLANFVGTVRRKQGQKKVDRVVVKSPIMVDVSVDLLDNAIKELKDLRQFLIDTVKENTELKARITKFKKFLGD